MSRQLKDIVITCCVLHDISISEGDIALDFMDPIEVDQANAYNPHAVGPDPWWFMVTLWIFGLFTKFQQDRVQPHVDCKRWPDLPQWDP
jgi:hypothetical protein